MDGIDLVQIRSFVPIPGGPPSVAFGWFYLLDEIRRSAANRLAARQSFCTIGRRYAVRELELLSVVALLEDVAEHGLLRGQVGTVLERLAPGVYEVEFSDDDGRTYATLSLRADRLLQLRHEPSHQTA
jgi:hypothetical protein